MHADTANFLERHDIFVELPDTDEMRLIDGITGTRCRVAAVSTYRVDFEHTHDRHVFVTLDTHRTGFDFIDSVRAEIIKRGER